MHILTVTLPRHSHTFVTAKFKKEKEKKAQQVRLKPDNSLRSHLIKDGPDASVAAVNLMVQQEAQSLQ